MRMDDIETSKRYDTARLAKAIKGLAQKSNDFYNTNARLDILLRLMKEEPNNIAISRMIDELPNLTKSYIMKNIVAVMPDGSVNQSYNPSTMDKKSKDQNLIRLPKTAF